MDIKNVVAGIIGLGLLVITIALMCKGVNAVDPPETKCLVIVSGSQNYTEQEIGKAISFYNYLISTGTCTSEDIIYLTNPLIPSSDGPATVSNVEDAFYWLDESSDPNTDITIYVSDHELFSNGQVYFQFNNGNISSDTIDSWIDQITCDKVTVILNGERSALAGFDLAGSSRDIICSMGPNQASNPDLFNITRSLVDQTADENYDGKVDYIEAYWKEVDNLLGSGQDPEIYYF